MDIDKEENTALRFGVFMSVIMAIAGWTAYFLSGSEATLLDGNFSFISALATIIAMIIAKRKHYRSKTFPFGSYVYESLFVLVKGILILGVIVVAVIQNSAKIAEFLRGEYIEPVEIDIIIVYVVFSSSLCFILFFYYQFKNRAINGQSPILKVETQATLVDGFLSLGIGLAFIVIWLIPDDSPFEFLKSIGDALIVLVMSLIFLKMPFKIVKESFIELGGGAIQHQSSKKEIEQAISNSLFPGIVWQSSFISKLGSSYLIAVFITSDTESLNIDDIEKFKTKTLEILSPKFQNIQLEVILRGNSDR